MLMVTAFLGKYLDNRAVCYWAADSSEGHDPLAEIYWRG